MFVHPVQNTLKPHACELYVIHLGSSRKKPLFGTYTPPPPPQEESGKHVVVVLGTRVCSVVSIVESEVEKMVSSVYVH